jgi:glycosyltransferase involved in cell wall biosynthesis
MPHVWTPLLAPAIRQMGIRYATIVHDVAAHPGDVYGVFARWLLREAHMADLAITLSDAVAEQLVGRHQIPNDRVLRLFHPDLEYDGTGAIRRRSPDRPLRLLFFGRIMAYKGLTLLIDAVEMLRRQGIHVHLGVAGSGRIGPEWRRLAALDAEIVNRWIDDSEVGALLSRYDAVAAAHVEASQSGVVAAAFGHRLPVVAMPVGGIPEQVIDGRTGVLAPEIGAAALASAIRRLAVDPGLYDRISAHLHETAAQRSMALFVDKLAARLGQSA